MLLKTTSIELIRTERMKFIPNEHLESINPLRREPVLEIHEDSGGVIFLTHSMIICKYLDSLSEERKVNKKDIFLKAPISSFNEVILK